MLKSELKRMIQKNVAAAVISVAVLMFGGTAGAQSQQLDESPMDFNENITLSGDLDDTALMDLEWDKTGEIAVIDYPNLNVHKPDQATSSAIEFSTRSDDDEKARSYITSKCVYFPQGKKEIQEIKLDVTRLEDTCEGCSNPYKPYDPTEWQSYNRGGHTIVLASLFNPEPGEVSVYVTFVPETSDPDLYPDYGMLSVQAVVDGHIVKSDMFASCQKFSKNGDCEKYYMKSDFFLPQPLAYIPMKKRSSFTIRYNQSFDRIDVYQNGIRMMSFMDMMYAILISKNNLKSIDKEKEEYYKDILKIDFLPNLTALASRFNLLIGDTQEQSAFAPHWSKTRFENIYTTFSRACNYEMPPVIANRTAPPQTEDIGYQKSVGGADIGVYSGDLTTGFSPPTVKTLGENYAPAFVYFSGEVNRTQKVRFKLYGNVATGTMAIPDTHTVETSFSGESRNYEKSGAAGQGEDVESEYGINKSAKKIKTDYHVFKGVVTHDYQDKTMRLKSVYAGSLPEFGTDDDEDSPYGVGWRFADAEGLKFSTGSTMMSAGADGAAQIYRDTSAPYATESLTISLPGDRALDAGAGMVMVKDNSVVVSSYADNKVYWIEINRNYNPNKPKNESNKLIKKMSSVNIEEPGQPAMIKDRIYVPSRKDNTIYVVSGNGKKVKANAVTPDTLKVEIRRHLSEPSAVAGDAEDKNLMYVANFEGNNVIRVNMETEEVDILAGDVLSPTGLVTYKGKLYVLHRDRAGMQKVSVIDLEKEEERADIRTVRTLDTDKWFTTMSPGAKETILLTDSSSSETGGVYRLDPGSGVAYQYIENLNEPAGAVASGTQVLVVTAGDDRLGIYIPGRNYESDTPGDFSKLEKSAGSDLVTKKMKHGTRRYYDAEGRLTKREDRNGNSYSYKYDTENRSLKSITDPVGGTWKLMYNNKKLARIEDPIGRQTQVKVEGGSLTEVTYPEESKISYSYNNVGLMRSRTNMRGKTSEFELDGNGRVSKAKLPEGETVDFAHGKPVEAEVGPQEDPEDSTYSDFAGNTFTAKTDKYGALAKENGPLGYNLEIKRDAELSPTQVKLPDAQTIDMTYDNMGNNLKRSNLLGGDFDLAYEKKYNFPVAEKDPEGKDYEYEYDERGNIVSASDAMGNTNKFEYNERGLVTKSVDPLEKETLYEYDDKGNLEGVTPPCANEGECKESYTRDAAGNVEEYKDGAGNTTRTAYDLLNRVLSRENAAGRATYEYDGGLLKTATLPGSRSYQYGYDDNGWMETATDPLGRTTSFERDGNGNLKTAVKEGRKVEYAYDDLKRLIEEKMPIGTRNYEYDEMGRVTKATDAEGRETAIEYYADGSLKTVKAAGRGTTAYGYDKMGNVTHVLTAENGEWAYMYDDGYRLRKVEGPEGVRWDYEVDANGNTTKATDAKGNAWRYAYAENDLLKKETDPEGNETFYEYDGSGRLSNTTDAVGRTITYTRDAAGRVTQIHYPDDTSESYDYSPAGFVEVFHDRGGRATGYDYDANGNLTVRNRPGYAAEYFRYDEFDVLSEMTKRDGNKVYYERDEMSRLKEMRATDGTGMKYEYDETGLLTRAATRDGESWAEFENDDEEGWVNGEETYTEGWESSVFRYRQEYTHSPNGRLVVAMGRRPGVLNGEQYYTGGSYEYTQLGGLKRLEDGGVEVDYGYDETGRLTSYELPTGLTTSYEYDRAGRFVRYGTSGSLPDEGYNRRGLTRDGIGRITGYADSEDGNGGFEYSAAGYLTHASYDAKYEKILPSENYSYDGLGHRVGGDYVNEGVTDQLVYDGSYHYTYDGNGNETGRELDSNGDEGSDGSLWRYEYDDLDRLERVKFYGLASAEAAGQSPRWEIEYRYDWAGRLIERRFSGHTNIETFRVERYVYEGDNVVLMMDENNEVVASFHHAAGTVDRPVYMEAQGQRYYYHYDERGSVIYLTNSQGQIVQRFWYDSFGKLTLDVGMLMPGRLVHTYTGRMWDSYAEVYHYRARVYDPKTGRFLQHDPVFSANPYAYVSNDPVNNVDPYGLREICGTDPNDEQCYGEDGKAPVPAPPSSPAPDPKPKAKPKVKPKATTGAKPQQKQIPQKEPDGDTGSIEIKPELTIDEEVELAWYLMITGEASREVRRRFYNGIENLHSELESLSEQYLYQLKKEDDLFDKAKPSLKYMLTKGFANLSETLPTNDYDLFLFAMQFEGGGENKFPKDPMKFLENVERKNIKQGYRWKPSDKIEIEYHKGGHPAEPNKPPHYHVKTEKINPNTGKKNMARQRDPNKPLDDNGTYYPGDPYP